MSHESGKLKQTGTPVEKKKTIKKGSSLGGAHGLKSSNSGTSFGVLTGDQDEDEDDCEERVPLSQVQELVAKQVQAMMSQFILLNQANQPSQASQPQVATRSRDLPALEKMKNFKGETDTDELTLWLEELERHCIYYEAGGSLDTDAKKLAYAVSHLIGGAAAWWKTQQSNVTTYKEFLVALQDRFQSVVAEDKAADELYDLRQKEGQTVTSFSDRFIQLLVRIPDMNEKDKIRHFKRGLLPTLQQKVREKEVSTLNAVIELAIRLESTFAKKPGLPGKSGINAVTTDQQPTEQTELLQELINQIQGWKKGATSTSTGPSGPPKERCWRCGGLDHITDKCQYTANVCWYCKKPGHIKMECKALKARQEKENKIKPEGSTK